MAQTTIFKATDLFPSTEDKITNKYVQTGLKTLSLSSGEKIPENNSKITKITFLLDNLRYQRLSSTLNKSLFFLTNMEPAKSGDHWYVQLGAVSYIGSGAYFVQDPADKDSSTGKATITKPETAPATRQLNKNYPIAYCFDPFNSEPTSKYRYRSVTLSGNLDSTVKKLFYDTTTINVNLVSYVTRGAPCINYNEEGYPNLDGLYTCTWTCTVEWDYLNTSCTAPTSVLVEKQTSFTTGKEKKVTLSWSGANPGRKDGQDNQNKIIKYEIYRNGDYLDETTANSITVTSPATKNTTYTYTVKPIGTLDGYGYNSSVSTASATLKAYWTNPEITSFTCTTSEKTKLTGTVYVGGNGTGLTFNWSTKDGDNNDIAKITLTTPNSNSAENVTNKNKKQYVSGAFSGGKYILTIEDSNGSTFTKTITVNIITGEAAFNNVIDTYPKTSTLTDSSISVTLKSLTASTYNSNSIKYNLLTDLSDNCFYKDPVSRTDWKTSIDLLENNFLQRGQDFKLIVRLYYYAQHGGYSVKDYTIANPASYKIVGLHSAASIVYLKDEYSTQKSTNTDIFNYGYGTITIKATPAKEDTSVASGDRFSYVLKIQHDKETSFLEDVLRLTKTEADEDQLIGSFSLQNFTEGTELTITIESKDENLLTATSNAVFLTKIKLPTIDSCNLSIDASLNSNKQKGNAFGLTTKVTPYVAVTKIGYKATIYAPDNETSRDILSATSEYTSGTEMTITTSEATVIYCDPTEENSLEEKLYNTVIVGQNPQPQGRFVFSVWYEGYEYYQKTIEKEFKYDYTTELAEILSTDYSIGYPGRNYLNPFEEIPIYLKNNGWTDAVGGTSGGIVEMTLLQSGTPIKLNDLNATDSAYPIYAKVANYKYSNYNARDSVISLILKYTLTYGGNSSVIKTIQVPIEINLAKWIPGTAIIKNANYSTSKITVTDSEGAQIEKEILVLEGNFGLPLGWCGSTEYKNIKSLKYAFVDTNKTSLGNGSIENNFDNSSIEQRFSINLSDEQTREERQIKATLIFTNTSDETITLETDLFSLFVSDVSIAIRKNKIGINVDKNFGTGTDNLSILTINSLTELSNNTPILHINSPNTPSAEATIDLMSLSAQGFSSIFSTDGEHLVITNLNIGKNSIVVSDENGLLSFSSISVDKLGYLADVTGNIQEQLSSKQNNITGAATTIADNNLEANKVLISNDSGKVAASNITNTQLSYLSKVTQNIQDQLDGKAAAFQNQAKNTVFAGPADGESTSPAFRTLVAADIPSLDASIITSGTLPISRGGTGATKKGADTNGALNKLGIIYADSLPAASSYTKGTICLVAKKG